MATKKQPIRKAAKKAAVKRASPTKAAEPTLTGRLVRNNLLIVVALLLMVVSNVSLVWYASTAKTEIIAINEQGAIVNPIPLGEAFVTDSRVLAFFDECLRSSFSHDFENYRRTINESLRCYTSIGRSSITKAFEPLLEDIKKRRLVISTTVEPPVILRGPYLQYGRVTWEVQTVVTLFFSGTQERFTPIRRAATATIVRVPLSESPLGIGIEAIQLAPYSGN